MTRAEPDLTGASLGDDADLPGFDPGRVRILGVRIDAITFDGLLERIAAWVDEGGPHQICTVNPEFVMAAQCDAAFAAALEAADLCIADGVGLLWAARRQGKTLPERVTGSDGVPLIAQRAAEKGWRLYLLGAGPGIAEAAGAELQRCHPALKVVGAYPGTPSDADAPGIIARIRAAQPDVLFVAYGAPKQDLWIARHKQALQVPAMIGVGGSLDFVVGAQKRAPAWIRRINLEWLYRLVTQPWRWRRQLALPKFVWAVITEQNSDSS